MNIIIAKNPQDLADQAFVHFYNIIQKKKRPRIGLATGSSPLGLYKRMIESYQKGNVSYKNTEVVNLDEYIGLPEQDPNKYSHFLHQHLLDHADFSEENIDLIMAKQGNVQEECLRYHKLLIENPVDIQILGLGSNCHIGFNEPGTTFDSQTHIVKLKEDTRKNNARFFTSLDQVPKEAITVGIRDIMSAQYILLVASGKQKAQAVKRMLEDDICTDCPASILRVHKSVTIILDEEAASLLNKERGELC